MRLNREFYEQDPIPLAKDLLGKIIVNNTGTTILKAKIVETEAYLGVIDKAAHTYGGKKTKRVMPMYGLPGTSYVYLIYGMYYCFNIVAKEEGVPEAVLIRAIEPVEGIDEMAINRFGVKYDYLSNSQKKNLSNGPGKLCIALNIDKNLNEEDLCGDRLYLESGKEESFEIIETTRIGIDYAEEAKDWPCKFYIKGNTNVSKL